MKVSGGTPGMCTPLEDGIQFISRDRRAGFDPISTAALVDASFENALLILEGSINLPCIRGSHSCPLKTIYGLSAIFY